jgi:K+-sensing histidine kinase KdpD
VQEGKKGLFYVGAGPLAAVLLGIALVPLRGLTPASNLSFAFMALTIVVAEFGGRWAATATALVSALSLDFFLTKPYLRLAIEDNHDVVAFASLAVCGLIAATLGAQRSERIAALSMVRKHRDLLRSILRQWDGTAPIGPQVTAILRAARDVFPLAAAVVRDERGTVVAGSEAADASRAVPDNVLQPDTLLDPRSEGEQRQWRPALPEAGGRIALVSGARSLGFLDVWGNRVSATMESRRALSDLARLLAVLIAATAGTSSPHVARD